MKLSGFPLVILLLTLITLKVSAQKHLFGHYRVPLYHGSKAKPIIKGNSLAEMFKTTIKKTYYADKDMIRWHGAAGLNFAGHYCFVYWGCGSDCQDAAIVDVKTGIVYHAITAARRYKFERNSRLMIVNPNETIDSCAVCAAEYWVWNERRKMFIKI